MDHDLSLGPGVFKAHGHGNDYLVFQEGEGWRVSTRSVQLVCDPHRGPGGDGIVALLAPGPGSSGDAGEDQAAEPFRLRMFNPDGGEFERSGNGLRILGAFLHSSGRVPVGRPFPVEVGGEGVEMEILGLRPSGVLDIAVEMGEARFGVEAVGGRPEAFGAGQTLRGPDGGTLAVHLVSMGNPHCVLFRRGLLGEDLMELGPALTVNPAFPAGVNLQLARVVGEGEVEILIWERGVGRTAASGTSACAVASACVRSGRLAPGRIRVWMEGGSFFVTVSPEMRVRLEGPVDPVFRGTLADGFLERLDGGS